jgi:hypothetical protein
MTNPRDLAWPREEPGGQDTVQRSPDTIAGWEDDQISEFGQRLLAGASVSATAPWLVAIAVTKKCIQAVAEGSQSPGVVSRTLYNPKPPPVAAMFHLPAAAWRTA